jgi:hypothetical protein
MRVNPKAEAARVNNEEGSLIRQNERMTQKE